jgi:hypothetical protein
LKNVIEVYSVIFNRWFMSVKSDFLEKIKKVCEQEIIKSIVVASKGGKTAIKIAEEMGKDASVVSVSEFSYSENNKKDMKKRKITPIENANLPIQDLREMRETLLMFDSGIKAALEVASIASTNGLVKGKFITIAGSGSGLDTTLIVNTVHPNADLISEPLKRLNVEKIVSSPLLYD